MTAGLMDRGASLAAHDCDSLTAYRRSWVQREGRAALVALREAFAQHDPTLSVAWSGGATEQGAAFLLSVRRGGRPVMSYGLAVVVAPEGLRLVKRVGLRGEKPQPAPFVGRDPLIEGVTAWTCADILADISRELAIAARVARIRSGR